MVNSNYLICSLGMFAIRTGEGDRPFHSDNMPSLNTRFLAGSGTPTSAEVGCENKLELVSESRSSVEIPS